MHLCIKNSEFIEINIYLTVADVIKSTSKILTMFSVNRAYSRHWGNGCVLQDIFSEKSTFCQLAPSKQMSFLIISNENIFCKTQDTKLGALVAPIKGLELALLNISDFQKAHYVLFHLICVSFFRSHCYKFQFFHKMLQQLLFILRSGPVCFLLQVGKIHNLTGL